MQLQQLAQAARAGTKMCQRTPPLKRACGHLYTNKCAPEGALRKQAFLLVN